MKQIQAKLLSGLLSLVMLTSLTMPVFAYNSIGSNSDLDNLIGEDTAQGTATEYHDPINSNVSSAETDVYVTRSSTFTVLVPKTIILSGSDGFGEYVVGARGDVLTEDSVSIEPDSYELTLYKKNDASKTTNAFITQTETLVSGAQIEAANGAYAVMEGSIEAPELKAGSWSTKMTFNIRLVEKESEHLSFTITSDNKADVGYKGTPEEDLIIPESFYDKENDIIYDVVEIEKEAFAGCTDLNSVTVPDSVISIGDNAFEGVNDVYYEGTAEGAPWGANGYNGVGYANFTITADNAYKIGYDNTKTAPLVIPETFYDEEDSTWYTVTEIGDDAFRLGTRITAVTFPDTLKVIGKNAFYGCVSLKSVVIPDSVETIGVQAFFNCRTLTSAVLPNGLKSIEQNLFGGDVELVSVTIPNTVTFIGYTAFSGCSELTLRVPSSVNTIQTGAFSGVAKVIYSGSASGSPWGANSISRS